MYATRTKRRRAHLLAAGRHDAMAPGCPPSSPLGPRRVLSRKTIPSANQIVYRSRRDPEGRRSRLSDANGLNCWHTVRAAISMGWLLTGPASFAKRVQLEMAGSSPAMTVLHPAMTGLERQSFRRLT